MVVSLSKVFLITSRFPYGQSEQFLEHEMPYWKGLNLTILPLKKDGDSQRIQPCAVDDRLTVANDPISWHVRDVLAMILDKRFWWEFVRLCTQRNFSALRPMLIYTILSNRLCRAIIKNREFFKAADVVYCYWSNWSLRGVALAKKKEPSLNFKLISRSHRVDLYEYAIPGKRMPYRHEFHPYVDAYYPISEDGRQYLQNNYGVPPEKVKVHRLGVPATELSSKGSFSSEDAIRIVSVSYAKKVKRIDRIIDALAMLEEKQPELRLAWTHIGGGDELESLKKYAADKGVTCNWLGMQSNHYVMDFLSKNQRSIFINVSDSEGVPVSIMEALSFGIPVVATDVGGSREVVNDEVGRLVPYPFRIEDIASGILELVDQSPSRQDVHKFFTENFSVRNYLKFIQDITKN